jgi:hypothetical protein
MYWLLNKETNAPGVYSNIRQLSEATGLNQDRLYYYFSRLKRKDYETEKYRIVKVKRND